ncbi:MAG TPA: hypothetical protein PLP29_15420 [Candidatus Ozemobacteraceae bacterium]|nr:hypothetical protein [Candidatus Ozemobacteraceae bacterium]
MTDSRGVRPPSPTGHTPGEQEALARRLDELTRQRERLIEALGTGGKQPGGTGDDEHERLREENARLRDLLSRFPDTDPEKLSNRLRQAERTAAERQTELEQLRRNVLEQVVSPAEIQKRDLEIEQLKLQITDIIRGRADDDALRGEIQQLKVNLADALLEQKQLTTVNQGLLRQIAELKQEIYQHQAQVRDLSMRLDLSKRNETALSEQDRRRTDEMTAIRTTSAEVAESRTKLEEQVRELTAERARLVAQIERAEAAEQARAAERQKHAAELEAAVLQREAAENREQELTLALDALRGEKQALKEKVDHLLVGVRAYVTQPVRPQPTSADAALEPRELQPYLPFCFPDRLPRQLRPQWVRTRRLPVAAPAGAAHVPGPEGFSQPDRRPFRQQYHLLAMSVPPTLELGGAAFPPPRMPAPAPLTVPGTHPSPGPSTARPWTTASIDTTVDIYFPLLHIHPDKIGRIVPPPIPDGIRTRSLSFFLEHLAASIRPALLAGFAHLAYRLPPRPPEAETGLPPSLRGISPGRVAIHTRSHLQFAVLGPGRVELSPDFPRGRLKFLLQTFGDSITSMMARLDDGQAPSKP